MGGESEPNEAIRNLVLLVASLSFCGHTEIKLTDSSTFNSLYQLEGFKMPEPENRGTYIYQYCIFGVYL